MGKCGPEKTLSLNTFHVFLQCFVNLTNTWNLRSSLDLDLFAMLMLGMKKLINSAIYIERKACKLFSLGKAKAMLTESNSNYTTRSKKTIPRILVSNSSSLVVAWRAAPFTSYLANETRWAQYYGVCNHYTYRYFWLNPFLKKLVILAGKTILTWSADRDQTP